MKNGASKLSPPAFLSHEEKIVNKTEWNENDWGDGMSAPACYGQIREDAGQTIESEGVSTPPIISE